MIMSKAVMISIRPEWCAKIANGQKTIEVRKNAPNLDTPFKCFIYCTNGSPYLVLGDVFRGNWETEYTTTYGYSREEADRIWGIMNGKVIGEFICDRIFGISLTDERYDFDALKMTGLKYEELEVYLDRKEGYGWHISNLMIYDKPKELSKFVRRCKAYGKDIGRCWDYSKSVGDEHDCGANGILEMKRPPQSWCYVEGVFEYD